MYTLFKNIIPSLNVQSIIIIGLVIIIGSTSGQPHQQNYLLLKGKVLRGYTAEIAVFQYFDSTSTLVYLKKNKTNYSLVLNPQLNYQIFFLSNDAQIKVLHIDAGEEGIWVKEVDVDFDLTNIKHAKIYQSSSKMDYNIVMVSDDYINQKKNTIIKGEEKIIASPADTRKAEKIIKRFRQ